MYIEFGQNVESLIALIEKCDWMIFLIDWWLVWILIYLVCDEFVWNESCLWIDCDGEVNNGI